MTMLGKTLIFLNLIFGIGAAVVSTSLYSKRPGWFTDTKEGGIDKGHFPFNFAQMTADIDSQGKAANLANINWSTNSKALAAAEATRDTRLAKMYGNKTTGAKGLIDIAQEGAPNNGTAFFVFPEDPLTRLLDLDSKTEVKGPNDTGLKGTDTLLTQFTNDAKVADEQAILSKMLRGKQKDLGDQIGGVQEQIYKQQDIRNNLVIEATRLGDFEVNATEHMQTVTRRRNQLIGRLAPFRSLEKK
jgi:hypothetical protein